MEYVFDLCGLCGVGVVVVGVVVGVVVVVWFIVVFLGE